MSRYKISVVQEPPTAQEFDRWAGNTNKARVFGSLLSLGSRNLGLDTVGADLQIAQGVRTLKQHLGYYHNRPQGNEAYYPHRRQDLLEIAKQSDHIIGQIARRIAGRFDYSNAQYDGLRRLLEGIHYTAVAKANQLLKLSLFLTDKNINDMESAMEGKFSRNGKELRAMSPAHMAEYYCGFAFNFQNDSPAFFHFEKWLDCDGSIEESTAQGFPDGPPAFPVYLESKMKVGFGEQHIFHNIHTKMSDSQSVVTYDGSGKRSKWHVKIDDCLLWRTSLDPTGVLVREEFNTTKNNVFILDEKENLYIYEHDIGRLHHSSATAGRPVICAGKLTVVKGKITAINDHSGHYQPQPRHLLNALKILNEKNVFDPGAFLEMHGMASMPVKNLLALDAASWTAQAHKSIGFILGLDALLKAFGTEQENDKREELDTIYGSYKSLLTTSRRRGQLQHGAQSGPPLQEPARPLRHGRAVAPSAQDRARWNQ